MFAQKKPLNQLENPIEPTILKGPPRFAWSGKHWTVGSEVTRDTEHITQFYEDAILAQPRDYNKTVYGQSSHAEKVNGGAFRPPLLNYYEDIGPLNRVPCTIRAITPRINPGTAGFDSGTSGFTSQMARQGDENKNITDRVKSGPCRPTFYSPFEEGLQDTTPDLELNIPSISHHSGFQFPERGIEDRPVTLTYKRMESIMDPGSCTDFTVENSRRDGFVLENINPMVSVDGGFCTQFTYDNLNRDLPDYENTIPSVSADANIQTQFEVENFSRQTPNLENNSPYYSASSGSNYPSYEMISPIEHSFDLNRPLYSHASKEFGITSPMQELQIETFNNLPQTSADSGFNSIYTNCDNIRPDRLEELEQKLYTPLSVTNAGDVESGYKNVDQGVSDSSGKYNKEPIKYSYITNPHLEYTTRNEHTFKPHHREKLIPEKGYGKITFANSIPVFGIQQNTGIKLKQRK